MKKRNRVAFFNILSTLLLRGISFFTMPLFTRLLGDSGYGVTQAYETWTGAFSIVLTLQTFATLVNARIEYPEEEQERYQSSVMSLSLLAFSAFSVAILMFLGPVSRLMKLHKALIVLMLLHSFGTFCINFLNTKFVYEFKAGRNMLLSVTATLLAFVLSVVFVLNVDVERRYVGRIGGIALTYTLLGLPACIWILARGRTFFRKDYWKFCIALAVPAMFYNLSDLILGHSDTVMLQQMLGDSTVGRYAAAANFSAIMLAIFHALNNSWCPFFFDDFKRGDREQVLQKARNFLEVFTVLSAGFVLLVREVFQGYVPEKFWESAGAIPLLVGGLYLNFLCTFPVNFEYYHKKTKVVATVTITCSLLNVALNYVLILRMGMVGAAAATLISRGLQLLLHYCYSRYWLKGGEYPFGLRMWIPYLGAYAGIAVLVVLTPTAGLLRWALGAGIGVWELLRIRKRRVLI